VSARVVARRAILGGLVLFGSYTLGAILFVVVGAISWTWTKRDRYRRAGLTL